MSDRYLLFDVRLHDNRWYGAGGPTPSPLRLFQALLAAAALGRGETLVHGEIAALDWLAQLDAPIIAAQASRLADRETTLWVPNNDLDAVGGDPANIGKIRTKKVVRPRLFDENASFQYLWLFKDDDSQAEDLIQLAERLYQFGRGVDMAYARAEILTIDQAEERLAAHSGPIWRPAGGNAGGNFLLRCPHQGTLKSLTDRHAAQLVRLRQGALRQPPPPRFRVVGYDCPPTRLVFDIKAPDSREGFHLWPLTRTAALAVIVRDGAVQRLRTELPSEARKIERTLVGRNATQADKAIRVRILPLPSIGSPNADPAIRRVLVEIPPDCPISVEDLSWAFSGIDLGEDKGLVPSNDRTMLRHYGVESQTPARVWQTVTPAALPIRRQKGCVSGADRSASENEVAHTARQALRHAGITVPVDKIRVQREPFFGKGERAEAFANGSRFEAARLWHVEIAFHEAIPGPLTIGDGRYCGLGLMAPVRDSVRDILIFSIRDQRPSVSHRDAVVCAVRRAIMGRNADEIGQVKTLFSGHESGPGPARSGRHRHVYLFADDSDGDGLLDEIGIVAPWRVDRSWTHSKEDSALFDKVASGLRSVRAGAAGVLVFRPAREPNPGDPLFARARTWASRTPYSPTRHPRRGADVSAATADDLLHECLRRDLPRPEVEIAGISIGPRGGISAEARLRFNVAVAGPILLGRDAHRGGGLFAPLPDAGSTKT